MGLRRTFPPCSESALIARQNTSTNEMERIFFIRVFCVTSVQAGILSLLCSPGEMFLAHMRNMLTTLVVSEALSVFMPE